jgi:hypothetical protein
MLLIVVTSYKCSINPVTNRNPVCSYLIDVTTYFLLMQLQIIFPETTEEFYRDLKKMVSGM